MRGKLPARYEVSAPVGSSEDKWKPKMRLLVFLRYPVADGRFPNEQSFSPAFLISCKHRASVFAEKADMIILRNLVWSYLTAMKLSVKGI